jgi:acyl-CoA thioester hydrolase
MHGSEAKIRVRYEETDKMGIVYHANYFQWFEVARIQFLDEIGMPYKGLEEDGYFLPVLECTASFKMPARFDDRVSIISNVGFQSPLRLYIEYHVFRGREKLAEGSTTHAFVCNQGKVIRPPDLFTKLVK